MREIDRNVVLPFKARYGGATGFAFVGRRMSNRFDIREACVHIYKRKHVLYQGRTRIAPQRWRLTDDNAIRQLDELLDGLANKIWDYFDKIPDTLSNQENFDSFHNELCRWFLAGLNSVRNIEGLPLATYGNSQKMINVLFKYLACFDDYREYADLFSYCHIPIDNYILGDFIDFGVVGVTEVPGGKRYNGQCWHQFDERHYLELLIAYRDVIGSVKNANLSYLAAEFCLFSDVALPAAGTDVQSINKFYM